jgi:hypothetical protein
VGEYGPYAERLMAPPKDKAIITSFPASVNPSEAILPIEDRLNRRDAENAERAR